MDSVASYLISSKIKSTTDGFTKSVFGDDEEEDQVDKVKHRRELDEEKQRTEREEAKRREKNEAKRAEREKKNDEIRARYGIEKKGDSSSGSKSTRPTSTASASAKKQDDACVVM